MINRVLGIQLLIVIAVSAIAAVFGVVSGYSALLGGVVSLIANLYFARKVLIDDVERSAQSLLLSWYVAEFMKIAMIAVLLAAVYVLIEEISALALIGGFFVAYVGASIVSATVKAPGGNANGHSC